MRRLALLLTVLALTLLPARGMEAQLATSIGAGLAQGTGDWGDQFDQGWTVRGQAALDLLLAGLHAQVGATQLPGANGNDDATIFHAGVGGRVGLGLLFVGANANYYLGDVDNGVGFAPEVGISFLMLEAVADYRVDGDQRMWGARVALKF